MGMIERIRGGLRRMLLGPEFDEAVTKALPPATRKQLDMRRLEQRGQHENPTRNYTEPGGKGPRKQLGFSPETLRQLARTNPWLRAAVDIRKREVASADWDIVPALDRFEKELITLRKLVQSMRRFPDRADRINRFKANYIDQTMVRELLDATRDPSISSPEVRYRFALALTDRYIEAESHAAQVRPLFERPNANGYGWSQILQATVPDLFTIDAMCIENRRLKYPLSQVDPTQARHDNRIIELHWVDGATVRPVIDKHGMLAGINDQNPDALAYEQWIENRRVESGGWRRKDLTWLMENPQTDIEFRGYGFSRVESLVITSLLEAYGDKENIEEFKRGMYGGFLVLQKHGIDQEDIEEERIFIEEELEGTKKLPLIGMDPDGKVSWVSTSPYAGGRDKKSTEMAARLVKRIAATFEIPLIKLAEHTSQNNRATSQTTQSQDDDGLRRLLEFVDDGITRNIVDQFGHDDIKYASDPTHMRDEKERLDVAKQKLELGIWERNDARMEWGEDPAEDGDTSWWYWTEREKAKGMAEGQAAGNPQGAEDPNAEGEDAANTPGDGAPGGDDQSNNPGNVPVDIDGNPLGDEEPASTDEEEQENESQ